MNFLLDQPIKITGIMSDSVQFVLNNQLKDKAEWIRYVDVFSTKPDGNDNRWRGEYFGKQMRGASYVYSFTKDEELYETLNFAVAELLKTQDEYGRISTYTRENEFSGWDLWCRKYVLTGLIHFYRICKDNEFKKKILDACCRHLDYITERIGPVKIDITKTSSWWGCVNSCTILEPTIELYKMTGKREYLNFAEYIISTGGSSDCDFVSLALDGKLFPYQYPVTKAYETMSFFEGLLAYYEATGKKTYFEAASKFVEAVNDSDITIIGCAGCTHELFDNSAVKQTEYSEQIMQETCVTVTWMRLLSRLYFITRQAKYIDRMERSGFNALYGSLNTEKNMPFELVSKEYFPPKAFDSYSPLYMNSRGRGIGGFLKFADGGYGGCCIAIGANAVALMPLSALTAEKKKLYLNFPFNGTAEVFDADGKKIMLELESGYPSDNFCRIKIKCKEGEKRRLSLNIRRPDWCDEMTVNGADVEGEIENGYFELCGTYGDNDVISFEWKTSLKTHRLNGKIAFTYGALTLAADSEKSERKLETPVETTFPKYKIVPSENGELIRIIYSSGDESVLLTDYRSCGKNWRSPLNKISVWLNENI